MKDAEGSSDITSHDAQPQWVETVDKGLARRDEVVGYVIQESGNRIVFVAPNLSRRSSLGQGEYYQRADDFYKYLLGISSSTQEVEAGVVSITDNDGVILYRYEKDRTIAEAKLGLLDLSPSVKEVKVYPKKTGRKRNH